MVEPAVRAPKCEECERIADIAWASEHAHQDRDDPNQPMLFGLAAAPDLKRPTAPAQRRRWIPTVADMEADAKWARQARALAVEIANLVAVIILAPILIGTAAAVVIWWALNPEVFGGNVLPSLAGGLATGATAMWWRLTRGPSRPGGGGSGESATAQRSEAA